MLLSLTAVLPGTKLLWKSAHTNPRRFCTLLIEPLHLKADEAQENLLYDRDLSLNLLEAVLELQHTCFRVSLTSKAQLELQ